MSVNTNGFAFQDGTILGATAGGNVPQGLNNAFADALSLGQTTPQTINGPIVFNGLFTPIGGEARNTYTFTTSGNYTVGPRDRVVLVKKATPQATQIILPNAPVQGRVLTIKDAAGNADSYPITVVASQNLDGTAYTLGVVIDTAYGSLDLVFNGTTWNVMGGIGYLTSNLHDMYVQNVKGYGAVGNGATDDTAAIQAAANAAAGGTLYFPPGNYVVSAPITLPSNVLVYGEATITAAIAANWTGGIGSVFSNSNGSNITIQQLSFVYPYGSYGTGTGRIMSFTATSGVKLQNLISDGGADLAFFNNTLRTVVAGCASTNLTGVGLEHVGNVQDATCIGNYLATNPSALAGASGISFSGVNTDLSAANALGFHCVGNTILLQHSTGGQGIYVHGPASGGTVAKLIITNNRITLNNIVASGIYVDGLASNGVIHTNYFEGCSGTDAAVYVASTASGFSVSDNRVDNWQAGTGGIFAIGATNSIIFDNACTNSSSTVIGPFNSSTRQYNNAANGSLVPCASYETVTVITNGSSYTATPTDRTIIVNKSVGSATTILLPANPYTGLRYSVKDGKGDGATNNVTISGNGNTLDGGSTVVLSQNYAAIDMVFNGTAWNLF